MESQLPNITGEKQFYINTQCHGPGGSGKDRIGYANYIKTSLDFDASRASDIYKNNVTQVYGDSISMYSWIKAKMLDLNY